MLLDANARNLARSAMFNARRFNEPGLGIVARPSFAIGAGDKVYGIGSCFARAVAYILANRGHSVSFGGLYHRYNTFNILQTVRWALDDGRSFSQRDLIALDDGRWFDPHGLEVRSDEEVAAAQAYGDAAGALTRIRASLADVGRAIRSADVMVLTLGLVEVWRDERTGVWLNLMPPRILIDAFDARFTCHRTRQGDNKAAILELFRTVRAANPGLKLICSVSPIPLRATFCFDDVLVATAYGKATLRSALQEAIDEAGAAGMEHIDYFPSFEIVSFQRNDSVYKPTNDQGKPDGLHIRPEFLEESVKAEFCRAYLGDSPRSGARRAVIASNMSTEHTP